MIHLIGSYADWPEGALAIWAAVVPAVLLGGTVAFLRPRSAWSALAGVLPSVWAAAVGCWWVVKDEPFARIAPWYLEGGAAGWQRLGLVVSGVAFGLLAVVTGIQALLGTRDGSPTPRRALWAACWCMLAIGFGPTGSWGAAAAAALGGLGNLLAGLRADPRRPWTQEVPFTAGVLAVGCAVAHAVWSGGARAMLAVELGAGPDVPWGGLLGMVLLVGAAAGGRPRWPALGAGASGLFVAVFLGRILVEATAPPTGISILEARFGPLLGMAIRPGVPGQGPVHRERAFRPGAPWEDSLEEWEEGILDPSAPLGRRVTGKVPVEVHGAVSFVRLTHQPMLALTRSGDDLTIAMGRDPVWSGRPEALSRTRRDDWLATFGTATLAIPFEPDQTAQEVLEPFADVALPVGMKLELVWRRVELPALPTAGREHLDRFLDAEIPPLHTRYDPWRFLRTTADCPRGVHPIDVEVEGRTLTVHTGPACLAKAYRSSETVPFGRGPQRGRYRQVLVITGPR
jgi:hypothetical protein